jgi:hypothetical protein
MYYGHWGERLSVSVCDPCLGRVVPWGRNTFTYKIDWVGRLQKMEPVHMVITASILRYEFIDRLQKKDLC